MERFATGGDYIFNLVSLFCLHVFNLMFYYEQTCTILRHTYNSKTHQTEWDKELQMLQDYFNLYTFPSTLYSRKPWRELLSAYHHLLLWGHGKGMILKVIELQLVEIWLKLCSHLKCVYTVISWAHSHWRFKGNHSWDDFALLRFDRTWIFF